MAETCHDCGVKVGEMHQCGCDAVICSVCGIQLLQCGHYPEGNSKWTGEMYPELRKICVDQELYCRDFVDGKPVEEVPFDIIMRDRSRIQWHVPCKKEDFGAGPDLNKAGEIYSNLKDKEKS